MKKINIYLLSSAVILVTMGALLKIKHLPNANASLIASIIHFIIFVVLYIKKISTSKV